MSRDHNRYQSDAQRHTRRALNERGIEPGKGMGQNFMTDKTVASWIVGQLDIQPGDTVIEIGPGMGALTEHLVPAGVRLILLEKDDQLREQKVAFARMQEEMQEELDARQDELDELKGSLTLTMVESIMRA